MQRWKITVEYDGTDFAGWQRQDGPLSVQQVIEEAIFKLSGETVRIHTAGRTDAGVHALGQVAHFDLQNVYPDFTIRDALNVHLRPHAVAILQAEMVPEFHARFHAVKRHYRYHICNRAAPLTVGRQYAWQLRHRLNIDDMRRAAEPLLGQHDFSSFRAIVCQAKSPIKTIDKIEITAEGEMIYIDVSAPSFLHHQVRNIVGTLKKIGEGAWPVEKMAQALAAKDRAEAGPTAPPHGLFLLRVDYTVTGNK